MQNLHSSDNNATLLSAAECSAIVETCLHTNDFKISDVDITPRSDRLLGFLGEHWNVKISTILPAGGKNLFTENRVLQFFAKSIPKQLAVHAEFVTSTGAYVKETGLYTTILRSFTEILTTAIEHTLTASEQNERSPVSCRCYFTRPDILVLEDLSLLGFKPLSSRIPMDLAHCSAVLKTMARFHAASIVFEEQRGRRLESVCSINQLHPDLVAESLFSSGKSPMTAWFLKSIDVVIAVAKLLPKYDDDDDSKSSIEQKVPPHCRKVWELVKPSKKYRNVVCHGDLWSSNVLFSYNEDDTKHETPTGVRLVDFQLARYAPPAHDVMCFLYLTMTRAIREVHEHDLLRLYHAALGAELACHGLDCEKLLSWSELQESCHEQRVAALVICTAYFPSILNENPDDIMESSESFNKFVYGDRSSMVTLEMQRDSVLKARFTDVVEELVDYALNCGCMS